MPPSPPAGRIPFSFYGCERDELTTELDVEYKAYHDERRAHRERNPEHWDVELADETVPKSTALTRALSKCGDAAFVKYWCVGGATSDDSGLSPGDPCHMTLKAEYRVKVGDYWKARERKWRALHPVATFWSEFETSAIEAERVIAIVRRMNLPGRGSMGPDTFRREIFLRVNRFVLEQLLEEKLAAIAKLC